MPGLSPIFVLSIVGTGAWVVALISAAIALRRASIPCGPFILLILAGGFLLGGHLLGACAGNGRGSGVVDQASRPCPEYGYVDLVVHHSYRGDLGNAAGGYPGGLLQRGLEIARTPSSGLERLVDRLRGDLAHNR